MCSSHPPNRTRRKSHNGAHAQERYDSADTDAVVLQLLLLHFGEYIWSGRGEEVKYVVVTYVVVVPT